MHSAKFAWNNFDANVNNILAANLPEKLSVAYIMA